MNSVAINLVFPAFTGAHKFSTQTVNLGGVYPQIEIVTNDVPNEPHLFKIAKNVPHCGRDMIASVVAEGERQIDHFWNVLSYVCDVSIRGAGKVLYEANGQLNNFDVSDGASMFGTATLTSLHAVGWIASNATKFH